LKPRKEILLTFDYEPYLGARSGSAEKCILQPTEALRAILNKHQAKGIFFVDIFYLLNLKKHKELNEDLAQIIKQLKTLYAEGHYIFPHIHPHWLDSVYLENKREFSLVDLSNYSLAGLPEFQIKNLFKESIQFLKEIGISNTTWAYRAGGWCIQPFNLFKDIFIEEEIKYEFSVLPGYKNDNTNQFFDFSQVTKNTPYYFSDYPEKPEETGLFIEFPISTIYFNSTIRLKDRLVRKYLWKTGDKGWGDGTSAQTSLLKSNSPNLEMVSIELLNIAKLNTYKKHLKNSAYMHWISHPKMFTKHGLKTFDSFLHFATTHFNPIFDFREMIPKPISK